MENKKVYIETYGCQMNIADTELVESLLIQKGYSLTKEFEQADAILVNTCSVREHAEDRIYGRLGNFQNIKKQKPELVVGILGCMAERLRKDLIENNDIVDIIIGPDEYRKINTLLDEAFIGQKGIAVKLSRVETYDDIIPYREDGVTAWISVMRGCDKFCSFCVVPFTRGRERSRSMSSIIDEIRILADKGFKDITLLGQNVNSYNDNDIDFADLLKNSAKAAPGTRIRFTTSHPQDLSDKLINTIAEFENICNYIHLPFQSGSNRILELMNRNYTIEHYLSIIERTRKLIPDISYSTDIIAGFPTETDKDHKATLDVLEKVRFDGAYMFKYSPRENTKAFQLPDDIPDEIKIKRLNEIINLQRKIAYEINSSLIGKTVKVLIEDFSKKSKDYYMTKTDTNKVVIIPKKDFNIGDFVYAKIENASAATLFSKNVSYNLSGIDCQKEELIIN